MLKLNYLKYNVILGCRCNLFYAYTLNLVSAVGNRVLSGAFRGTAISSINLSKLRIISGTSVCSYIFSDCSNLTTVEFTSLEEISNTGALRYGFQNCSSLQSLSFPALITAQEQTRSSDDIFYYMLYGCSNVVVHFPSNLQATIGNWESVTSGFNGTNTTILFDLDPTE